MTTGTKSAELSHELLDAELTIRQFTFDGNDGVRARKSLDLIMATLRALFQSDGRKAEAAWLVEINEGGIPIYFQIRDDDDWTADHNAALRLARREDAQQIIDYYGWTSAKPIEHMWCDGPALPSTESEGRK